MKIKKHDAEKKIKLINIFGYILGLSIFSFIIYIGGTKSIKANLRPALFPFFCCFISNFFIFLIGSLRWSYITNKIEKRKVCSYFDYFFYFMSSSFSAQFIPRGGGDFILRPGLLNRSKKVPFKKGVLAVFLEKAVDFLFIFIFIVPAILYIFNILTSNQFIFTILLILAGLFFLFVFKNPIFINITKKGLHRLLSSLKKLPILHKIIKDSYFLKLENLHEFKLLREKSLFSLLTLTLLKYFFLCTRLYFLSVALGLNIPGLAIFAGIPIAQLSLILSFTPGALGILEGGWYAVFAITGISEEKIITFLIGQRIYWFVFTTGIFLLSYLVFGAKKLILARRRDASQGELAKDV